MGNTPLIRNPSAACRYIPTPPLPPHILSARHWLLVLFVPGLLLSSLFRAHPSFSLEICEKGSQGWGRDKE